MGRMGHGRCGNSPTSKSDGIFHLSNRVQSQAIQSYQRFSLTWLIWELHFYETSTGREKNDKSTKWEEEKWGEWQRKVITVRCKPSLSSQQLSIHSGHQSIYAFHLVRSSFAISHLTNLPQFGNSVSKSVKFFLTPMQNKKRDNINIFW